MPLLRACKRETSPGVNFVLSCSDATSSLPRILRGLYLRPPVSRPVNRLYAPCEQLPYPCRHARKQKPEHTHEPGAEKRNEMTYTDTQPNRKPHQPFPAKIKTDDRKQKQVYKRCNVCKTRRPHPAKQPTRETGHKRKHKHPRASKQQEHTDTTASPASKKRPTATHHLPARLQRSAMAAPLRSQKPTLPPFLRRRLLARRSTRTSLCPLQARRRR